MRIEIIKGRTSIYADDGKGVCPKLTHTPIVNSATLSPTDSPNNWEDCELGEVTEADKDAALRGFGVEV